METGTGTAGAEPYGLNIGRFLIDYRHDWVVTAGPYGSGYAAQWRDRHGKGRGQRFTALDLDQLAAILDREQNRRQRDDL